MTCQNCTNCKCEKPWVILYQAGHDGEHLESEHDTFKEAVATLNRDYGQDEIESEHIQIMKRRDDGVLTSEY